MASAGDDTEDPYHDRALIGKSQDDRLLLAKPAAISILGSIYQTKPCTIRNGYVFYAPSPLSYFDQATFLAFARRPDRLVTNTDCLNRIVGSGHLVNVKSSRTPFVFMGTFGGDDDGDSSALLFNPRREDFVLRNLTMVQIPPTPQPCTQQVVERMKLLLPVYLDEQENEVSENLKDPHSDGDSQDNDAIEQVSTSNTIDDSDRASVDGRDDFPR